MTIAVNRNFANADGYRECDFFNIVAWRGLADNCDKFLSKGKKIAVAGNLQTRSWEGEEGIKKFATEVMAEDIEFLSPKSDEQPQQKEPQGKRMMNDLESVDDENLPF